MKTLKEIFEKENPEVEHGQVLEYYIKYSDWLEAGISKEYATRDRLILELLKEVKDLKTKNSIK